MLEFEAYLAMISKRAKKHSKISLVGEALLPGGFDANSNVIRRFLLPAQFHLEHLQQLGTALLQLIVLKVHPVRVSVGASSRLEAHHPRTHLFRLVCAVEIVPQRVFLVGFAEWPSLLRATQRHVLILAVLGHVEYLLELAVQFCVHFGTDVFSWL